MTRPWRLAPLAAAAAAVAVALVPASASAQDGGETEPISGDVVVEDGLELTGTLDEEPFDVWANVLGLKPHGSEEILQVYCIDIRTDIDFDSPYAEGEWTESGVANLEHVRWVLAHGHPNATAEDLLAESGAAVPEDWDSAATARVAYAGTQAAVWHFTDGFTAAADPVIDGTDAQNRAVSDVYEYLVSGAGRMPDPSEYFVELGGLDEAEYEDGRFGPYTVRSNAGPVELSAEGGSLVDENGDEVTVRDDGEQFHIVLDEDSEGITITGKAAYDLPIGRVFLATTEESLSERATNPVSSGESQKLILAQPRESEVPAEWRFALDLPESGEEEEPEAQPQLPVTGSNLTLAFAAGFALLIGGLTAAVVARRRPSAEQTLR